MRFSVLALGLCLGLAVSVPFEAAQASRPGHSATQQSTRNAARAPSVARPAQPSRSTRRAATSSRRGSSAGSSYSSSSFSGGISCVPYARQVSGMDIRGNGRDWWHNSAGQYARGQRPEIGSILSFPSSGGMRSGHVAVVSRVINARHIEIDHANWGGPGIRRGSVMHGVSVIDVSSDNSWTQVRVQVGHDSSLHGRPYPTHGFIHNRPDRGEPMYATTTEGFQRVSYTQPRNPIRSTAPRQRQVERSVRSVGSRATAARAATPSARPSSARRSR